MWHRRIRIITIAAELEGAAALVAHAVSHGVAVSLGHQICTGEQLEQCRAAGASLGAFSCRVATSASDVLEPGPSEHLDSLLMPWQNALLRVYRSEDLTKKTCPGLRRRHAFDASWQRHPKLGASPHQWNHGWHR